MKLKDIQVGETYLTRVSGTLVAVRVIREVIITSSIRRTYTGFIVKPVDGVKELPKPRRASALRVWVRKVAA